MKKYFIICIVLIICIICVLISNVCNIYCIGINSANTWQLLQKIDGTVAVVDGPGIYWRKKDSIVYTYPQKIRFAYQTDPNIKVLVTVGDDKIAGAGIWNYVYMMTPTSQDKRIEYHRITGGDIETIKEGVKKEAHALAVKQWKKERIAIEKERIAIEKERIAIEKETINIPIFGVYLGETLASLRKRTLQVSLYNSTYDNNVGQIWTIVDAKNKGVNRVKVYSYGSQIYKIDIDFEDASHTSYKIFKRQLGEKYGERVNSFLSNGERNDSDIFSKSIYMPQIDGIKVKIELNRDIHLFTDDSLELTYIHLPLEMELAKEISRLIVKKRKNDRQKNEEISSRL